MKQALADIESYGLKLQDGLSKILDAAASCTVLPATRR